MTTDHITAIQRRRNYGKHLRRADPQDDNHPLLAWTWEAIDYHLWCELVEAIEAVANRHGVTLIERSRLYDDGTTSLDEVFMQTKEPTTDQEQAN
jgi:hypothetical protein